VECGWFAERPNAVDGAKQSLRDRLLLSVGDGLLLFVDDGLLLSVGDRLLLSVGDGLLLSVGDRLLLSVGDGLLLSVGDGLLLLVRDRLLLLVRDGLLLLVGENDEEYVGQRRVTIGSISCPFEIVQLRMLAMLEFGKTPENEQFVMRKGKGRATVKLIST
jgi:hypothetical protein